MNISWQRYNSSQTINIVGAFLILGLLRLLPFNFFASIALGHDIVVNNREGNAINFINYIAVLFLIAVLFVKLPSIKLRWKELLSFVALISIYFINFLNAPFVNGSWVLYQVAFISIAALVHLLISNSRSSFTNYIETQRGLQIFVGILVLFALWVLCRLYLSYPLDYIVSQYNDAFINSVNDIGVMKQYFGYVSGFLLLYAFFMVTNYKLRIFIFVVVLCSAFGIRSFLIGIVGTLFFASFKKPVLLFIMSLSIIVCSIFLWETVLLELVYDTRFYAYMNALDIVQKFPFGVGLGGYPVYTEIYNNDLFASFFNVDANLSYVPNSPESDIVHIFGSLGLGLGLVHLFIQLRILFLGLIREFKMSPFQKCMFYYFVFMTAFGISEDTMFTVSYWIFFGIASGIVASLKSDVHA